MTLEATGRESADAATGQPPPEVKSSSEKDALLARLKPPPLVQGEASPQALDEAVFGPMEAFPTRTWWIAIAFSISLTGFFFWALAQTVLLGIGTWGNNSPVGWGWAIVNFVFWIGIGHAGTLISAILFLMRQKWRTGIARFAEAMTVFAVICALQFPLFHTGRPWLAWAWLIPYPNGQGVTVNFRSPLLWDVFAVSTYGLVSFLFWYLGLLPDLANARDRAKNGWRKLVYGLASLGWNGSARAWVNYEKAYLLFAGLATPLVVSVHSVVSFDFAISVVPGWHTTIFPPYFVAGAILSGFSMVATLIIVLRKMFKLEHIVTTDHLEAMNKVVIVTSLMVGYAYATELFISWYSGVLYEKYVFMNRAFGPYAPAYWTMVVCNVFVPQLLWFKKVRRSIPLMYPIVLLANVGMWFERAVIVITSLHRDYLPSSWGMFVPTAVDVCLFLGSAGIFLTLLLLFCRFLPTISVTELKAVLPENQPSGHPPEPLVVTEEAPEETAGTEEAAAVDGVRTIGMVGMYDHPDALLEAARTVREAGFEQWDCHTPWPVHGLEKAMGVGDSVIPYFAISAGLIGAAAAFAGQWFSSSVYYPIVFGGKRLFSWPGAVPITFDAFILLAALTVTGCVFLLCRLGRWHSPLHDSGIMPEVTSHRFAVVLEAADPQFSEETARALLEQTGCQDIRPLVEAEDEEGVL